MKNVTILALLVCLVGCGGQKTTPIPTPGQPLDPQGNWQFTMAASDSVGLDFAGQLYELAPPIVTANTMLGTGPDCRGTVRIGGQASGTDTITLSMSVSDSNTPGTYALVGTIAPDQKSMSGTWSSSNTAGCTVLPSGTWSAFLLPPVTGTWTGTGDNGLSVAASLTENTDQRSQTMGQISGSLTFGPSACFASTLPLSADYAGNDHFAQSLTLTSAPDTNGAFVSSTGSVGTTSTDYSAVFTITGGPCDGQTFTAALQN
jgi:hypothetical protein